LFFQIIIIGFYIFASILVNKKASKFLNIVDIKIPLEGDFSLENQRIRKSIQKKMNIDHFDFKIILINTVSNEIDLQVFY